MKLDLLRDQVDQTPIVRFYDYANHELEALAAAVSTLADSTVTTVNLSDRPWVQSLDGFLLLLKADPHDIGLVLHSN